MDPITIAMGLANVVPSILKLLGHENAAASAQKVVEIAQKVTGSSSGEDALAAVKANPELAVQLQQELDRNSEALAKLGQTVNLSEIQADTQDVESVNATMQAEARAEHWPTYSWRPFIGFAFGALGIVTGMTVAFCYVGVMFFNVNASVLGTLPQMIGSEAAIMATMAPVLGIASWFRGKMQADPSIPPARKI